MMMKNKLLAVLLTAALVLMLVPAALAEEAGDVANGNESSPEITTDVESS